ncbi:MAG: TIGR03960 family B12-binding radical SAM protein [Lachnospiraceae bacterium]|nr:TIGR03960 family B12-binding radical SAM protein [Lachnospiraceae bacterium]
MRKLALPEEILLKVEKPARYIGGEINCACGDFDDADVNFCMCFPDVYEIGMSHLGIQILYDMFNSFDRVNCDRVYSPWNDLDRIMRDRDIPLFAVETQRPVKDFDFLGITLQYEMCYTNVLQVLELSHIPLFSRDRTEDDPIVIGGGPCTYNPEPIADFFDMFYIGEGETRYRQLLDLYLKIKKEHTDSWRSIFLHEAAKVPGIYVPSLYEVSYYDTEGGGEFPAPKPELAGTIREFRPVYDDIPATVRKEIVMNLDDTYYPEKPLVPYARATQDRVVLEIQRGCIRGCRFCQAGMIYRPVRERSLEFLKNKALKMLKSTGQDEITLSSLSSSDYSHLQELVNYLVDNIHGRGINVSLPSLRIDAFSLDVMSRVQDVRKGSVTFAPEAGTQRMRNVINKGLTEEDIIHGSSEAFAAGWNKVKLYFMLGQPTETTEDVEGIAVLSDLIARKYYEIPKDKRNGRVQVSASSSFFVPKPFTPFQWCRMNSRTEFIEKAKLCKANFAKMLNAKSLRYSWHDADTSVLEGVLARGDRRVGAAIYAAYKKGCIYDAWTESFVYQNWLDAFEETGVTFEYYNERVRSFDEILPWDYIDCGVNKKFLWLEWQRAQEGRVTGNCRMGCAGCGALVFGGGVCFENKN